MAYDLNFSAGPNYTTGKYGTGIVNSSAVITNSALGSLSAVTIESWFAKTNVGYGVLIGTRYGPEIGTSAEGFARFRVKHEREVVTAIQVCDGQLHHMALCVSLTGGTTFFVDGVKVYTDTVANGFAEEQFGIGVRIGVGYSWDGVIDDIAITGAIKYTADFVPGQISTMQPNLLALYQFENNIDNTAGVVVQASALTLTGPATGSQGVASAPFTVTANGALAAPRVVTPTPVAGVTFSPTSVTLTDAARSATFTATSSTTGAKSIAVTNDGALANPAAITWTVAAVDNTAPKFVSARVSHTAPNVIEVTFSEALAASLSPPGAFLVSLGRTVTNVVINGAKVLLTVDTPYQRGDVITVQFYTSSQNPRLQDAAGNVVESFVAQPVLNAIKVAVPTASSPGRRVVRVGIGMDFAGPNELAAYMATQNLKNNQEILIAEAYDHWNTGGGVFSVPVDQQTDQYYCIVRPVPGYGEADLTPNGPFNFGLDGLSIDVSGELKIKPGVRFEGFRFNVSGNGRIALGGVNVQFQAHVCGIARSRIQLSGSQFNAISIGEYETVGTVTDSLIVRTAGTGRVEGFGVKQIISRNTFVALNGATGEFVLAGGQAIVENNAFINAGPVILNSSSSNVAGNYTNMALSTPRSGLTVVTGVPFVVNETNNFIPAAGSPLIGNATDSAVSIIDARNANRGIDPDVGAWQKVAANALPSGSVTGSPKPSGQQLRVPFSTTQNPTGATATLAPSATDPNGAITNTGTVTLDNVADTGEAVFADIAAGNYAMSIIISNDGGSASVLGTFPVSIVGIDGQPEMAASGPVVLSAPGKPMNLSAVAGNGVVDLNWNPPFATGGKPITGYTIVASTGQQFSATNTSKQVAAQNNVAVSYQVRAINEVGPGPLSDASATVTPSVPLAPPGAPTIGTAMAKNRQVMLTFAPGSAGDRPIIGYVVTPSVGLPVNVAGSPATLVATNDIAVTYQVHAISTVGSGPKSAASNSVTPRVTAKVQLNAPPAGTAPLPGLSGLKWSWFDQNNADLLLAPVVKGAAEQTDGTGLLELVLPGSALNTGQIGWLIVTNSDGTTTMDHNAFVGPVEVD